MNTGSTGGVGSLFRERAWHFVDAPTKKTPAPFRPRLREMVAISAVFMLAGAVSASFAQEAADHYDGKTAPEWIEILKTFTSREQEFFRRRACYALGQIRPVLPEAVAGLADALQDGASEPRWYAADALAQLGPEAKAAVPKLIAAMQSEKGDDPAVRAAVETLHRISANALGNIGPPAAEAVPALEKTVASTDPQLSVAAALALWKITGTIGHLRPLTEAIRSNDRVAAYAGLMALREAGPAGLPAAKSVVACLKNSDPDVRRAAVKTLSSWGLAATPALVEALGEPIAETRIGAATAAALILDDTRRHLLEDPAADAAKREEALATITGKLLPALMAHLADARKPVAEAVRRAVAMIGTPTLATLLAALQAADKPAEREALAATLRDVEDQLPPAGKLAAVRTSLLPQLLAALKSSDRTTRNAALRLFAAFEVGPEGIAALPQLQAALKDEDVAVRSDAAQALDRVQKQP